MSLNIVLKQVRYKEIFHIFSVDIKIISKDYYCVLLHFNNYLLFLSLHYYLVKESTVLLFPLISVEQVT